MHGLIQNVNSAHAQATPALNLIGSAGAVSVYTAIGPTNLDAVGFPGVLINRPITNAPNTQLNGRLQNVFGGPPARNGHAALAQAGGVFRWVKTHLRSNYSKR